MIAGPQVSHIVAQYAAASEATDGAKQTSHHERTEGAQKVLLENVYKLFQSFIGICNTFQEDSSDLLSPYTTVISPPSVA